MGEYSKMKVLSLVLLASSSQASILPLNLPKFGAHSPSLTSVKQCDGHENDAMVIIEATMPATMCMPSTVTVDIHSRNNQDMPMDLIMKLDLKKLTPFEMVVPCLNGIGSCEYEMCPMITEDSALCPAFPPSQPCTCPLLKGDLNMKGVELEVQDMGPILGEIMEGDYSAVATMYSASDKTNILGCVDMTFRLEKCQL